MEFDEIVVKDSPGLCRCCLSEGCYKDLGSEYVWMSETEVYADMLLDCFDISISQHNEGPNGPNRLICEVCITRLRDACNFKKQVLDSEKKFVDMVGKGEFSKTVVTYQDPMKTELPVQRDITDVEYLDEDLDFEDDNFNEPTETEATVEEDITVSMLPIKTKRGRPKKSVVKPEKVKMPKLEEKPRTSKVAKDVSQGRYDHCTSERRRKNMQIIFNNTSIMPFKWCGRYVCFYCGKNFSDYVELKKHTKSHELCSTKDYSLRVIKGRHIQVKLDISEIFCEICNEQYENFNAIVDHLICKHDLEYDKDIEDFFQEYSLIDTRCQYCGEVFSYFGYLINHINNAHPLNNFICDDCGLVFNTKRDLTVHFRHYHRNGGYNCEECSEKFVSYILLKKHRNNFHFRKCKSCPSSFASSILLQKHVKQEHPDDGTHRCANCLKEFHSSRGLGLHMSKCKMKASVVRSSLPEENLTQPKKKRNILQIRLNIQSVLNMSTAMPFTFFSKYSCFYCSKKYVEFEELKDHTKAEHPTCDLKAKYMKKCKGERVNVKIDISSLSCKICSLPMENFNTLVDHIIIKHKAPYDKTILGCLEPFKIIKDNIPCPYCPNVFRYFGILLRHINSEHSNNNRICDFCGKSFKNAVNLNVHITYAHTGSCECEICGTKYKNQWCLGRHRAKCHNVKDYKCPKCPELFQSQYHKQKHLIKVHDIGHKCSYCNKMFTRNSFMKDHIRRTHLKEKNVPCSVCSERFFDNYMLKLHMVKHKGERRFSCDVCGKAFLRRTNLSCHMEMHKKYGHVNSVA